MRSKTTSVDCDTRGWGGGGTVNVEFDLVALVVDLVKTDASPLQLF